MNAAAIRVLISKGLSASDILEVAEALEATLPRSSAAVRQANYRARKNGSGVTSDVTGDVTRPPKENKSNPLSDPNGSGGEPPADLKLMFDRGVALLTAAGHPERQARSMVGKWNKAHGAARTTEAIDAAAGKPDPLPYVEAILAKPKTDLDELMASIDRKYPPRPPPEVAISH